MCIVWLSQGTIMFDDKSYYEILSVMFLVGVIQQYGLSGWKLRGVGKGHNALVLGRLLS